jgi:hypothetical protein
MGVNVGQHGILSNASRFSQWQSWGGASALPPSFRSALYTTSLLKKRPIVSRRAGQKAGGRAEAPPHDPSEYSFWEKRVALDWQSALYVPVDKCRDKQRTVFGPGARPIANRPQVANLPHRLGSRDGR